MSWSALVEILRAEVDADTAQRIEARVRQELAALVIYVPTRPRLTREQAHAAVRRHRGNVDRAAAELQVDRSTIYRRLVR